MAGLDPRLLLLWCLIPRSFCRCWGESGYELSFPLLPCALQSYVRKVLSSWEGVMCLSWCSCWCCVGGRMKKDNISDV